jgi:large subunit ribosomal protein L2
MSTKNLKKNINQSFGRNNRGIITSNHRQSGHKRLYRFIQFKRNTKAFLEKPSKVADIQYDPNRSVNIALLHISDDNSEINETEVAEGTGDRSPQQREVKDFSAPTKENPLGFLERHSTKKMFILHPAGLKIGDTVIASENAPNTVGNALPLRNIPLGFTVHNVELHPGKGGQLVRSAGTGAQVTAKEGKYVSLRLPSGEVRLVLNTCWATIGQLGNTNHIVKKQVSGDKAGKMRWLGKRPHVRGVAKNPVDHPHGGGEGRASIGKSKPLTPWGKPTLGVKTRSPKKDSNKYIVKNRPR